MDKAGNSLCSAASVINAPNMKTANSSITNHLLRYKEKVFFPNRTTVETIMKTGITTIAEKYNNAENILTITPPSKRENFFLRIPCINSRYASDTNGYIMWWCHASVENVMPIALGTNRRTNVKAVGMPKSSFATR